MKLDTLNNVGIAYANEKNYFNALSFYLKSEKYEGIKILTFNNIGNVFAELGLDEIALIYFDKCISRYENGERVKDAKYWLYYSNRAEVFRSYGDIELMQMDIEKSLSINANGSNAYLELSKLQAKKCDFEMAVNYLNKALEFKPNDVYMLRNRGFLFQTIGEYAKSKQDYEQAHRNSNTKQITLYELGKAYFQIGDYVSANECYNNFLKKDTWEVPYQFSNIYYGIIEGIEPEKGIGYILCKTWFSHFDRIKFSLSITEVSLTIGDVVQFTGAYSISDNSFNLTPHKIESFVFRNENFYKTKVYHAIITSSRLCLNSKSNITLLEVFYPYQILLPFSLIEDKISEDINLQLKKFGYAFIEIGLSINPGADPSISYVKKPDTSNSYSNYKLNLGKERYSEPASRISDVHCHVCGMDEWCGTDGCPLDPQ